MNMFHEKTRRLLAGAILLGLTTGCEIGREFREVAVPSLHSGVSLILDGLVDGIFAVIDPDDSTTSGR